METAIYYAFIYLIEAIILWIYCSNILHSRYSKKREFFSVIVLYAFPFIFAFQNNLWINTSVFFICNFIYIFFVFYSKLHATLFHSAITTIVMGLSELIVSGILTHLPYNIFEETVNLQNLVIIATLSKLLYLLYSLTIIYLYKKIIQKNQIFNLGIGMLTTIPLLTVVITLFLIIIAAGARLSIMQNRLMTISAILLLIINVIIFGIYYYNQKKSEEFMQLQLQLQKEYDSTEYYKMLNEQNEFQNILIHDIKKHLASIALLNEQGEYSKVSSYIQNIIFSSHLQDSIRMTENNLLNSILCRYMRKFQNKQISFRPDIRCGCTNFLLEEDLTALFCNLLDNAYESCLKQTDSFIELNMEKREHTNFALLTMTNSCLANPFQEGTNNLISNKKDKPRHGFGIKSIKRIIKKYHGNIKMYYNVQTKTFHTIIMLKLINQEK